MKVMLIPARGTARPPMPRTATDLKRTTREETFAEVPWCGAGRWPRFMQMSDPDFPRDGRGYLEGVCSTAYQ
jgi:hypothetical protein